MKRREAPFLARFKGVSAAYLSELDDAVFAVPRRWRHGHIHTGHDDRVGVCRVGCNPRGWQPSGMELPHNPSLRRLLITLPD